MRARYNGPAGELSMWANGVLGNATLDGTVPTAIGNAGPVLNVLGGRSGNRFKGHMGDLLVFDRALSDAECATIEAALLAQYHLYVLTETATSGAISEQQGIATDGTNEYCFATTALRKRDAAWSQLAQNTSPFTSLAAGTNHTSDGCTTGGRSIPS